MNRQRAFVSTTCDDEFIDKETILTSDECDFISDTQGDVDRSAETGKFVKEDCVLDLPLENVNTFGMPSGRISPLDPGTMIEAAAKGLQL